MSPCEGFQSKRRSAQDTFYLRLKTLKPIPCSAAHTRLVGAPNDDCLLNALKTLSRLCRVLLDL